MIEVGRVCVKLAGRDAGKKGVVVDILDDKFVLIDGETRRRKCNVLHLEPLEQVVNIKKNAAHEEVSNAIKEIGLEPRVSKPKQKAQRPRTKRKTPDQLREQKQEKKKLIDVFRPKKKEEKAEKTETTLEAKAGLSEEKKEENKETGTKKELNSKESSGNKESKSNSAKKAPAKKKE